MSIPSQAARHIFVIETEDMASRNEIAVCVGDFDHTLGRMQRYKCGHSGIPELLGMERVTAGMRLCEKEGEIPVRGVDDLVRCTPLERASSAVLPPIPNCLIYNDDARNECAFLQEPDEKRVEEGVEDLWISKSSMATCSVDRHTGEATCSHNFLDGSASGSNGVSVFRAKDPQDICTDPTVPLRAVVVRSDRVTLIKCVVDESRGAAFMTTPLSAPPKPVPGSPS